MSEISSKQIKDGEVKRADLNTATSGSAVIRKVIAGTGISLGSTGADAGTGDVTVNAASASGNLVAVNESTLGSDSTVTSTSATASGLAVNYTAVTSTNTRYIDGIIDWEVYDSTYGTTDNRAEGFCELEYSTNGSSWSSLKTFTRTAQVSNGKKLVGTLTDTIPSQISTTSTTLADTGLQVDYTAVNGANDRYVIIHANSQVNRNASVCEATLMIFYYNGSSWVAIFEENLESAAGGASSTRNQSTLYRRFLHQASDDTPQYKAQYRVNNGTSSETFTLFPNECSLTVEEYATDIIDSVRTLTSFRIKHADTTTTPYYRITHKVTSGDTSKIYTGSVLRVSEVNNV